MARTAAGRARGVALTALERIDHDGAYANLVLPSCSAASGLDARDRAFATELVYGTTRMRRACDYLVDRFVVRDPAPEVRTLLRLGAYQLVLRRRRRRTPPSSTTRRPRAGPGRGLRQRRAAQGRRARRWRGPTTPPG